MFYKTCAIALFLTPLLAVSPPQARAEACSIAGRIDGLERQGGGSYSLVVIDASNGEAIGQYPARSSYQIRVDRSGRLHLRLFRNDGGSAFPARTNPKQRTVNCEGGRADNADFALQ